MITTVSSLSSLIAAAMEQGYFWTWLVLLFASAGVFHHAGIKIPYFAFFAHDSGKRCREAPVHMLIAMAISAVLCVGLGSFPHPFYSLLPFQVDFHPYSIDHVASQLQLLFFSALAFTLLMRTGIYPPELRSTNLDFDWLYRKLGRQTALTVGYQAEKAWWSFVVTVRQQFSIIYSVVKRCHGPEGILAGNRTTSTMVFWTVVMLATYLFFSYM